MNDILTSFFKIQFKCWWISSSLAVAFVALWMFSFGIDGFYRVIQQGPNSDVYQTLGAVAMLWCALGALSGIFAFKVRETSSRLMWAGSFLILALYVNLCREHIYPGDAVDYIKAAFELNSGEPFHPRYLYPPFFATLLQPLLFLGDRGIYLCLLFANLAAVPLSYVLLKRLLERYGFASNVAIALTTGAFILNVPLLRTLYYTQINIFTLICILFSFLLFESKPIRSALCLAVAVQLKISPIVLVVPFLWGLNKRWLLSFILFNLLLMGSTFIFYGTAPFLSVLHNLSDVYSANGVCFREFSVDSLLISTMKIFGDSVNMRAVAFLKAAILSAGVIVIAITAYRSVRDSLEKKTEYKSSLFPLMLVFMVLASPLIWVHHLVFVIPVFIILVKKIRGVTEWSIYYCAYFACFILPAFDFYPFSFVRLAALLAVLYLYFKSAAREDAAWAKRQLSFACN